LGSCSVRHYVPRLYQRRVYAQVSMINDRFSITGNNYSANNYSATAK